MFSSKHWVWFVLLLGVASDRNPGVFALFGIVVLASYIPLRFVQGGSLTSPADGRVLAASFCV